MIMMMFNVNSINKERIKFIVAKLKRARLLLLSWVIDEFQTLNIFLSF